MDAPAPEPAPLQSRSLAAGTDGRWLSDGTERFDLADLERRSLFGARLPSLDGACVLLWSERQLPAVRALLELDGVARRVLLCPPDLAAEPLRAVLALAQVDHLAAPGPAPVTPTLAMAEAVPVPVRRVRATEWVLFTSGTSGQPKLVQHTLDSLAGPLAEGPAGRGIVWSTFYDVRRYGGLQVLLRALLGGGSILLSQGGEPVGDFLRRAAAAGVTHLLGTPTHWRGALMSPALAALRLRYVRLSGEVADQAVLDRLAAAFPGAALTHAFASTEAGVGFEVTDGRAGFPAGVLGEHGGRTVRVVDGSLRLRSARTAARYLGGEALADADGFVDTGDIVEERGDRFFFAGRRGFTINVGGQKVHPEEVEAVLMRHPAVRAARVRGRPSPITGALVTAEVVLAREDAAAVVAELLAACRAALPPHKVPATVRAVDALPMSAAGKLERRDA